MPSSPEVLNYSVLKGIAYFTPDGEAERDLGNCPEFELTPTIDNLDHFSSRAGVRSKDRTVVREKTMQARVVLDEMTPQNLRLALLGSALVSNTAGNYTFGIYGVSEILGQLRFDGQNDIGNKVNITLPNCSLIPSGSLPLISDEWAQLELTADVLLADNGIDFGTAEVEEVVVPT